MIVNICMYVGYVKINSDGCNISTYTSTDPINCYICNGTAENSTCSDPLDVNQVMIKECIKGICLKWTKYKGGKIKE